MEASHLNNFGLGLREAKRERPGDKLLLTKIGQLGVSRVAEKFHVP